MKTLIIAAAAVAASATFASAENYFGFQGAQDDDRTIELRLVRADMAGTVEIREAGSGDLLGMEAVNAGANSNLVINLNDRPAADVVATLVSGGQVVAQTRLDIDRM